MQDTQLVLVNNLKSLNMKKARAQSYLLTSALNFARRDPFFKNSLMMQNNLFVRLIFTTMLQNVV